MTHKLNLLKNLAEKRDAGIKLSRPDRRLINKLQRAGLKMPPEKTDKN